MPTNFHDLPTEIWLLIARDLSKSQLFKLKSLNSFFLNYWMDLRWKSVDVIITGTHPRTVVRLLTRVADPFVAVRMKTLLIYSNTRSSSIAPFNSTLAILPLLSNITFLSIELTKNSTFYVSIFQTFFRTITSSSVARTLQKLSLAGDVEVFVSLGECPALDTPFKNLTELILDLGLNDNSSTRTEPALTLEPFLCSLAPTLQLLYLRTYSSALDLSLLFNAFLSRFDTPVLFPNLKSFCLECNFNNTFQSLRCFLLTQNNLQHLELNPILVQVNDHWDAWLVDLVNSNSQFPALQSLDIYPSTTQAGLSAVLSLIKFTASTLSSLTIPSRYLTCEEAKQVLDALSTGEVQVLTTTTTPSAGEGPKKLKTLSISIINLSVPFLDLLAGRLPHLGELYLSVIRIVGSDQYSFYDLLHHRRYDPNVICTQDVLHTWKLHKLSIWGGGDQEVRTVAGAVPALSHGMGLDKGLDTR